MKLHYSLTLLALAMTSFTILASERLHATDAGKSCLGKSRVAACSYIETTGERLHGTCDRVSVEEPKQRGYQVAGQKEELRCRPFDKVHG